MGASSSGCHGCFAGVRNSSLKQKPKTYEPFVPQAKPEKLGKLAVQIRIAARQSDAESLQISKDVIKLDPENMDEQGRNALFFAVRGTRDDDGNWDKPGGSLSGVVKRTYDDRCSAHEAVDYLVGSCGMDVNVQTYDTGMTPLMEAARHGNMQTSLALLRLGADWRIQNSNGDTALEVAQSQLPRYYSFKESCFSMNKWSVLQDRIQQDRMIVAQLMQEIKEKGSAEAVLADMRSALTKFIALVEEQEAKRLETVAENQAAEPAVQADAAVAPPAAAPQVPEGPLASIPQKTGMTRNPDGTYCLEAPPNVEQVLKERAREIRNENMRSQLEQAQLEQAQSAQAKPTVEAEAAVPAVDDGFVSEDDEDEDEDEEEPERPDAGKVQAAHEEMEVID